MNFTKIRKIFFLTLVAIVLTASNVYAAEGASIFSSIADKADNVAGGLKNAGYIIAGLGLIGFAVAAMFNKISWKTLAYIMMSTFFLTLITAIITWTQAKPNINATLVEESGAYNAGASAEVSGGGPVEVKR